ncbi:uncharacterized protein [Amphiura filiformis]|uniref:uncharacterized protein isoform X2 n=1 Tax=Amphiura filiformis TaxID=82378 RepID=UPI003B210454
MVCKFLTLIFITCAIFCCNWGMTSSSTEPELEEKSAASSSKETGSQKRGVEQNIIYGGILSDFSPDVKSNDTDLQSVVQFALNYAAERHPKTVPRDEKDVPMHPDVFHPRKLKLQYTQDGTTPLVIHEESFASGQRKIQRKRAIVGISYFLTLTWNEIPAAYQHNFIIRKDRKHQLHLHGHTFYRPTKNVFKTVSSSSQTDKLSGISHAMPVFVPVLPMQLGSQASCAQEGGMNLEECKGAQENIWKESAQHGEHSATLTGKEDLPLNASVKLVTYNIWNFNSVLKHSTKKFYEKRIDRLGQVSSSAEADIIGYQEVRFDAAENTEFGPSQVTHLAKHLPKYQFVYQPAMTFRSMGQEGLALFSKYPIISHDFILLSRNESDKEDNHQRVCLHAEIETPQLGILHVYVTHLSLSEEARKKSVVEIWKYMSQHPGPAVLMGDLNAQPDSLEYKFLQGAEELQGMKTSGLMDAWMVYHPEPRPDAPGTYEGDDERDYGLTFSTLEEHLRSRIDFIFVRLPDDIKLTDVSTLDNGGRQHTAPSDHLGLQVSLRHTTSQ